MEPLECSDTPTLSPSSPILPTTSCSSSESSITTSSTISIASSNDNMFGGGETFNSGNGEEVAVEPLENLDGKDENCKHCQ